MSSEPERLALADGGRRGAYGFRLLGIAGADELLIEAPASWPALEVVCEIADGPAPEQRVSDRDAVLLLRSGGWVAVERASARAAFSLPARPSAAALIHPHLGAAAIAASHWLGRESFHAGAIAAGGGAWGVLGVREAGKSSLLASFAQDGGEVLTDDILVLEGDRALAGPRSIDLRREAAAVLAAGEPLGVLGTRERWRLALPAIAPELPLRGWVSLRWGERVEVRQVRAAEKLRRLGESRALLVPPTDPVALIELSRLPALELSRPRRWEDQGVAIAALLAAIRSAGG